MNNIKDYRERELVMYILACILLYICLDGKLFEIEIIDKFVLLSNLIGSTLMVGVVFVFTFIIDSLLPSKLKDKILSVFGLIKKPGYTIFERIKKKNNDDRFSTNKALEKYSDIYENINNSNEKIGNYQNEKWYEIYSKYKDVTMISVSNRDYLLCRDMFFSTIILGIIYLVAVAIKELVFDVRYTCFLIIALIITFAATHIKARRLVYNVIAHDLSQKNDEE